MNAIYAFVALAGGIILIWVLGHVIGGHTGSMDPLAFFAESSTMGTILVLVVYFLANLALPFYYRRYRPDEFSVVKHAVLPILGMLAIAVPVYYLVKPGQPAPYSCSRTRRWSSWCWRWPTRWCSAAATPGWGSGLARSSPMSNPGRCGGGGPARFVRHGRQQR